MPNYAAVEKISSMKVFVAPKRPLLAVQEEQVIVALLLLNCPVDSLEVREAVLVKHEEEIVRGNLPSSLLCMKCPTVEDLRHCQLGLNQCQRNRKKKRKKSMTWMTRQNRHTTSQLKRMKVKRHIDLMVREKKVPSSLLLLLLLLSLLILLTPHAVLLLLTTAPLAFKVTYKVTHIQPHNSLVTCTIIVNTVDTVTSVIRSKKATMMKMMTMAMMNRMMMTHTTRKMMKMLFMTDRSLVRLAVILILSII